MRSLAVLMLVVAACGDDDPVRHLDGGTTDSPMQMIDAPSELPVVLTVMSGTTPQANVRVYFQNADSTLVSSTLTDASGVASAMMAPGGYVTAINPYPPDGSGSDEVYTFAGVKPADHLVLQQTLAGSSTDVTFIGPLDSDASVTGYLFSTRNGNTIVAVSGSAASPQAMFPITGSLPTATDLVIASLDVNNEVVHFLYKGDLAINQATIDLSGETYASSPTTKTYSYTNIPVASGDFNVEQALSSSHGAVATFYAYAPGGAATLKLPVFTNALDTVASTGYYTYGYHTFIDWGAPSSTYAVDVGARMLTESTDAPALDAANHRFGWTPAAGGQTPDFMIANAAATRQSPALTWRWRIASPYAAGSVQFPVLPVESGGPDYNFGTTDAAGMNGLTLIKSPGGYDAVRGNVLNITDPRELAVNGNGSVTAEEISQVGLRKKPPAPRKLTTRPAAWQLSRRM